VRGTGCAVVSLAVLSALVVAQAAGAAKKAPWDLRAAAVGDPPATAAPGSAFTVTWTVRRTGRRTGAARLRFLLSRDARASRSDVALAPRPKLKRLARTARLGGRTRLVVPRTTPRGRYRLLACVVQPRRKADRRKGNDCRASRGAVVVALPATPGAGPPGAGPPTGVAIDQGAVIGNPAPRATNPLDVTPTLETGSRVTQFVDVAGGTVTTTDDSGTVYTLTLPADALFSPTEITMTPVTGLAGMPGRLVGAVRLEPEGLMLNKAAGLEIQPAGEVPPADRLVVFTADGDGSDFRLLPDPGGGLTLSLLHFSIPGAGDMSGDEQAAVHDRAPASTQAQLEADMQDAVRRNDPDTQVAVARAYYGQIVKPALGAALTSDDAMNDAFAKALGWWRMTQLLGIDQQLSAEVDEMLDLLSQILKNAADRAYHRCVDDHDLAAVARMLQVERTVQLLGLDEGSYAATMEKIENCLRFELDFSSEAKLVITGEIHGEFHYDLDAQNIIFGVAEASTGPLHWQAYTGGTVYDFTCPKDPPPDGTGHSEVNADHTQDSTMRVALSFDVAPRVEGSPPVDPLASAKLILDTGGPLEFNQYVTTGQCGTENFVDESSLWEPAFGLLAPGVVKNDPVTIIGNLERGSDQLLLARSIDEVFLDGTTTVTIWHRPPPGSG
jgi:hypothetical protein